MDVLEFVEAALAASRSWREDAVQRAASFAVPDSVFGLRRGSILRADSHAQWAAWFVESFADPARYLGRRKTYAHAFGDVKKAVDAQFSGQTPTERARIAGVVATEVWQRVNLLRSQRDRRSYTREEKIGFLAGSERGSTPRCWICGFAFDEQACDDFLEAKTTTRPLPLFVDLLKPSGLNRRDQTIQIDHVSPLSLGGSEGENLRVSCGWCNLHKSSHRSTYDVEGNPRVARSPLCGLATLPRRFWIVRILALQRSCESPQGCSATNDTSELTVEPINPTGGLVPSNLRVTCTDHHWLGHRRLQPSFVVRSAWGG